MNSPHKYPHLFTPLLPNPSAYVSDYIVGVNNTTWFTVTVPTVIAEHVEELVGLPLFDKEEVPNEGITHLLYETDENCSYEQTVLIQSGLPFTVRVENADVDSHLDCRWINGTYSYIHVEEDALVLHAYYIDRLLKEQAYTALAVEVERRITISQGWKFTEEDIQKAKQLTLKQICME